METMRLTSFFLSVLWLISSFSAATAVPRSTSLKANKRSTPNAICRLPSAARPVATLARASAWAAAWAATVRCSTRSALSAARPARSRSSLARKARVDARSSARHVSWPPRPKRTFSSWNTKHPPKPSGRGRVFSSHEKCYTHIRAAKIPVAHPRARNPRPRRGLQRGCRKRRNGVRERAVMPLQRHADGVPGLQLSA